VLGKAAARGLPIGEVPGFVLDRTRSSLERRFLRLCRDHGLPAPEINVAIGPYVVDFLWRQQRLIVEVDSWRYHGDRAMFEADRDRDAKLKLRGFDVIRFTEWQLDREPHAVAATVRGLLARR
jgi:very-short-patch-repair endonuclease